jgi:thioredoxin reductase (NADPH)
LRREDNHYRVALSEGGEVAGRSVIVATGARYRRLDIPRLELFEGSSVHYAATEAEAQMCRGNSAGQAAVFLADRVAKLYLLIRGGDLGKSMSRYLIDRIERTNKIELLGHVGVRELMGDGALKGIVVEDNRSGERRTLGARALFVFIGAEANTGWLKGTIALDKRGFVPTGRALDRSELDARAWNELSREPFLLESSLPGVFAVGDVRSGSLKRVASAVGEGSMAVRFAHQYLAEVNAPQRTRVT